MALGMSRDEYWNGDIYAAFDYVEAAKERLERDNYYAWLQGRYIYDGFAVTASNVLNAISKHHRPPKDFPEEPYEIFPKKLTEEEELREVERYMNDFVKYSASWGKE